MRTLARTGLPTTLLAALVFGAAGCGESDLGTKGGEGNPEADLKRIESSNMPPQAKAAAAAQIKSHQGGTVQGSPTAGK